MKQTVTEGEFIDGFRECNRENNFTVGARRALFEYLCDLEEDMGEEFEFEFDPIGICCEYTQWADLDEINEAYEAEPPYETIDELREVTTVIYAEDFDFTSNRSALDMPMITSIVTQDW